MTSVFKDFDQAPALEAAKRAGFHDAHAIANLGFVLFVVGVKFGDVLRNFAKLGVWDSCDCADDDGFIHFVGDDLTHACLAKRAFANRVSSWNSVIFFAHLLCGWRRRFPAEHGFDTGDIAAQGVKHVRLL